MNTRKIGNDCESSVCNYLQDKGFSILERNFHCPFGEIDIIASKGRVLHVVEVKKMPANWDLYEVSYKVNANKMERIKRTCAVYLADFCKCQYDNIEFDVACIVSNEIHYWQGAF